MHSFTEIIDRCSTSTLQQLREANDRIVREMQTTGATSLVKTLQMIQLQKVIFAVGMLSIFEARLQGGLSCRDGFHTARALLIDQGERDLEERFGDLVLAINALKHGRGRSYDELVGKADTLPFKVKARGQDLFFEGDISEADTLVDVDDAFVQRCADVIGEVSTAVRRSRPDFY